MNDADPGADQYWRHNRGRVLCRNPLILTATTALEHLPIGPAPILSPALADRSATYLLRPAWQAETPAKVAALVEAHRRHREDYPHHRIIVLAQAVREASRLGEAGVPTFLCSQNAFVDEQVFDVVPSAEKRFDAVYNARLLPYKRHALAAAIPSLALIYNVVEAEDRAWLEEVRRLLPHAFYVNHAEAARATAGMGSPRARVVAARLAERDVVLPMPATQVAAWLNRARVGLCLSRTEGPMFASIEYLLCGLPVVSTVSLGGRDRYFDPDHTRIVADDPAPIAEAVAELATARIDPREIRTAALAMMRLDRRAFVTFVQELIDRGGGRTDFAARFPALLAQGLFPSMTIAAIAADALG